MDEELFLSDSDTEIIASAAALVSGAEESAQEALVTAADPEVAEEQSTNESEEVDNDIPEEAAEYDDKDEEVATEHVRVLVVVNKKNYRTSEWLSAYEIAEIISIRSTQIANHNNCTVPTEGLTDPIKMAKREFMMRRIPLVLRRQIGKQRQPDGKYIIYVEDWDPNTMSFSVSFNDVI